MEENNKNNNKFFANDFLFVNILIFLDSENCLEPYSLCFPCTVVGAIDVQVATVSKQDRQQTAEVYTIGFVASYLLPDSRPVSLDPFLEPLVRDFEDGFIEGS